MVKGRRKQRVAALIQREIAAMMIKDIKDPRLEGVTITHVLVSEDISLAKVFFCTHKGMDVERVLKGFESAKGFLRLELAHALNLKRVPELRFIYDDTLDIFGKIEPIGESEEDF